MRRAAICCLLLGLAAAAAAQTPRSGGLEQSLLTIGGELSTVRYVPGALDRAVHVAERLDMIVGDLRKRIDGPYPLAALVLGRREWEQQGLARPYGLAMPLGQATVVIAVPAAGDAQLVDQWKRWIGPELPTVPGVPFVGTAEDAAALVLSDLILQREACAILVANTLLVGSDPWIRELMIQLAAYTLYARYEPSRLPTIESVYQRLLARLPALVTSTSADEAPAERWLLQQAHFFEGARRIYAHGGQKALARLSKRARRDGAPLSRAVLARDFPEVETWLSELPEELGIR